MTARQPRRARRRLAAAPALPRPSASAVDESPAAPALTPAAARAAARRAAVHHREHHVTRDYSHVHRDLITVSVVAVIVIAFVVGMSFVI